MDREITWIAREVRLVPGVSISFRLTHRPAKINPSTTPKASRMRPNVGPADCCERVAVVG